MSNANFNKEVFDKRLKHLANEDHELKYQNKYKDSYQSFSGVLSQFQIDHSNVNSASISPNDSNENIKSLSVNPSFRTLNSRLQLQEALPIEVQHPEIKSHARADSSNFYIESDLEESDTDNDEEQFQPQPLVPNKSDDKSINQILREDDELELFRETRKGYFEAIYPSTNDYDSYLLKKRSFNNDSQKDKNDGSFVSSIDEKEDDEDFDFDEDIKEYEENLKMNHNRILFNIMSFDANEFNSLPFFQRQLQLFKHNYIKILKSSLAYFIAMVLCTIPKCRKWLTDDSLENASLVWFLPLAVIIHHPSHFFSIQIDITIQAIFGGMLGLSWSLLALLIATSNLTLVNNTHGSGALLWLSLFLATVFSYWLSNTFRRLVYMGITFTIAAIYYHSINLQKKLFETEDSIKIISSIHRNWKDVVWPFAVPYIIGLMLSFAISMLIFPEYNNQNLLNSFNSTMYKVGELIEMMGESSDQYENIIRVKQDLVKIKNFDFMNQFVEHMRVFKYTHYSNQQVKLIRDHLIELTTLIRSMPIKEGYEACFTLENSHIKEVFKHDLKQCLVVMQDLLKTSSLYLNEDTRKLDVDTIQKHRSLIAELKLKTNLLDNKYDNYDIPKHINENDQVLSINTTNSLLLIKSIRSIAKHLIALSLDIEEINDDIKTSKMTLQKPTISFSSAMKTLYQQCKLDQGSGDKYDTSHSVKETDKIVNEVYNTYTSKYITSNTKYLNSNSETFKIRKSMIDGISRNRFIDDSGFIRASSSVDFRSKTSVSDMRYLLWNIKNVVFNDNLWYGIKIAFVMTFFLLPCWLLQSFEWFSHYQLYTCGILFHILNNKNNIGGFEIVFLRLLSCLVGCFLGFVANVMKPFANPYVICWISGMLAVLTSHFSFNHQYTKNSTILLVTFTIIVCLPWDHDTSLFNVDVNDHGSYKLSEIWKNTWVTSLGLLIASFASVLINWILEPKSTYTRITESLSDVIKHLGDDFHLIVDRFLYKDYKDETTVLDNEFSTAFELKLTNEVIKLENLILKSLIEHNSFIHERFDKIQYLRVLNVCKKILENLIQARQEVQYFDVYNADLDFNMTLFLSTFRISSVSTCSYNFFLLSNSFRNKSKLPVILPNSILSRKKLYDKMALIETRANEITIAAKRQAITNDELIHGMAFSQIFTDISVNLEKLIIESKKVLGEDD